MTSEQKRSLLRQRKGLANGFKLACYANMTALNWQIATLYLLNDKEKRTQTIQ